MLQKQEKVGRFQHKGDAAAVLRPDWSDNDNATVDILAGAMVLMWSFWVRLSCQHSHDTTQVLWRPAFIRLYMPVWGHDQCGRKTGWSPFCLWNSGTVPWMRKIAPESSTNELVNCPFKLSTMNGKWTRGRGTIHKKTSLFISTFFFSASPLSSSLPFASFSVVFLEGFAHVNQFQVWHTAPALVNPRPCHHVPR